MDKLLSPDALTKAIENFATLRAFADAVGVSYQVVQQWRTNGVPAEYCPTIEKLTEGRVRCEQLNPRVDWAFIRSTASHATATRHAN